MTDAPLEAVTVIVRGKNVDLNPKFMKFNENNLSEYLEQEYGWLDYLGKQLEFANKECLDAEIEFDRIYSEKYLETKDAGNTENYSKAKSLADAAVVDARKKIADRKEAVGLLKAHIKAWDKNHDNAQNRGNTLRKEMDKLNREIYSPKEPEWTSPRTNSGGTLDTIEAEDFLRK